MDFLEDKAFATSSQGLSLDGEGLHLRGLFIGFDAFVLNSHNQALEAESIWYFIQLLSSLAHELYYVQSVTAEYINISFTL